MKAHREHLKLYLLGAAAAIGLAIALQQHLGDRVKLSFGKGEEEDEGKPRAKLDLSGLKGHFEKKEKSVALGNVFFLKNLLGALPAKAADPPKKGELEKKKEALKKAAIDYITEEMEEKLDSIGMKRGDMEKIVDSVSELADSIIEAEDLGAVIGKFKDLDSQLTFLIKKIHPKLVEAIKKRKA